MDTTEELQVNVVNPVAEDVNQVKTNAVAEHVSHAHRTIHQPTTGEDSTQTRHCDRSRSETPVGRRNRWQATSQHQRQQRFHQSQSYTSQQYWNQPYYSTNQYGHAQYNQGYWSEQPRWQLQPNGTWFDSRPQYTWESIFYHLPSAQRRYNEMYLYGYTFSFGL